MLKDCAPSTRSLRPRGQPATLCGFIFLFGNKSHLAVIFHPVSLFLFLFLSTYFYNPLHFILEIFTSNINAVIIEAVKHFRIINPKINPPHTMYRQQKKFQNSKKEGSYLPSTSSIVQLSV